MPIYEFYCGNCDTIYKFFSRSVNTQKVPSCPHCMGDGLKRIVSTFSLGSGRKDSHGEDAMMPDIDESKIGQAMAMLASEAEQMSEDDPRQAVRLMKKLSETTGIGLGPAMEEAMSRMERGEDPEKVEAEMGGLLSEEEPFIMPSKGKRGFRKRVPKVDETLYDL